MPRDEKNEKEPTVTPAAVGRTFRGETSPPITTPEAVAETRTRTAVHAAKPGATTLQVYFVTRGINNPILQASMTAYTDVRAAPVEVFDEIFAEHHEAPKTKIEETK